MSEMEVQIKITSDAKNAEKVVTGLSQTFEELETTASDAGTTLDKTASSSDNFGSSAEDTTDKTEELSKSLQDAADQLDNFERSAKKLGRDLSTILTVPLTALAGLSLKSLFDLGAVENSTGKARQFALVMEDLKRTFGLFLRDIGTTIAPAVQAAANALNNMMRAYMALDKETKGVVASISAFLAVTGPLVLAVSTVSGLLSKLLPVFTAIGSFAITVAKNFGLLAARVVTLVSSIGMVISLFINFRNAGVGAIDSIIFSFITLVKFINAKVGAPILRIFSSIVNGIGIVASAINASTGQSIKNVGKSLNDFADDTVKKYEDVKLEINEILKDTGVTAEDAMSFGLSSGLTSLIESTKAELNSLFSRDNLGGVLESEIAFQEEARRQSFERAREQYEQMQAEIQDKAVAIQGTISDSLASGFVDFANGAKSAEEAFRDFAKSTINMLMQMALRASIMKVLFPEGGLLTGATQSFAGNFASGGLISGPGTGTSDSILARVSNGEFVNDAKTVKYFGPRFFQNLKSMSRGGVPISPTSSLPNFADGGMVTSPSQAPRVVIENSGTQKEIASSSYDPSTAVTTIILEDLNKNGSISRGLANTFGMKRGASR